MNLAQVARLLAGFAVFFSLAQTIPLCVALVEPASKYSTVAGFGAALLIGLLIAALLWFGGRTTRKDFYRREGLAVVGFAWLLAGCQGAIPFVWSGAIPTGSDAFFECISGLTTTGATVLGSGGNDAIEDLPASILLWRAMIQWMGGLGIILVFIILLPAMGITGKNLLSSEQVGVSNDSQRPRLQEQGRQLFRLYLALTLAAGLLYAAAGMGGFDALCHAFTTMATGGFSTHSYSIAAYDSLAIELVAMVFMFLAGCNFLMLIGVAKERFRRPLSLVQTMEFKIYTGVTLALICITSLILWMQEGSSLDSATNIVHEYSNFGRCLRDASFQVISFITSTGYASAEFVTWPGATLVLLILCMLIGGSTSSTAGGFKMLRLIVCFKLIAYHMRLFVRPRSVQKLKLGEDVIPNAIVAAIVNLLLLWIGVTIIGGFVLSLDPALDLLSAFTASLSMMGCTGPSVTPVLEIPPALVTAPYYAEHSASFYVANPGRIDLGGYGGYGPLHPATKIFMSLQMILGRLEIVAPLAIITPSFWRR